MRRSDGNLHGVDGSIDRIEHRRLASNAHDQDPSVR